MLARRIAVPARPVRSTPRASFAAAKPAESQRTHRIALIPSDGIGKEVVPEAHRLLTTLGPQRFPATFVHVDAGWELFQRTGARCPVS